jgi:hypothetical protein
MHTAVHRFEVSVSPFGRLCDSLGKTSPSPGERERGLPRYPAHLLYQLTLLIFAVSCRSSATHPFAGSSIGSSIQLHNVALVLALAVAASRKTMDAPFVRRRTVRHKNRKAWDKTCSSFHHRAEKEKKKTPQNQFDLTPSAEKKRKRKKKKTTSPILVKS